MSDTTLSKEQKVRPCFYNLFKPGHECKEPAKWYAGGCALTGHWTYCDKHIEKIANTKHRKLING